VTRDNDHKLQLTRLACFAPVILGQSQRAAAQTLCQATTAVTYF
jgi:hypothetical protein